jgi:hypothetical protein
LKVHRDHEKNDVSHTGFDELRQSTSICGVLLWKLAIVANSHATRAAPRGVCAIETWIGTIDGTKRTNGRYGSKSVPPFRHGRQPNGFSTLEAPPIASERAALIFIIGSRDRPAPRRSPRLPDPRPAIIRVGDHSDGNRFTLK